jgi:serine/threonine-protein kinase
MQTRRPQRFPFQLGRYRVVGPIGEGAQAKVYRAYLEGTGGFRLPVALKVVEPKLGALDRSAKALTNEAKALAAAQHPNVVGVHDFARVDGRFLVAMEYIDGIDLGSLLAFRRLRGRTLPTAAAVQIAEQVANAMAHAHGLRDSRGEPAPLVHRDLKPTNVMISLHGQVKVTDWGLAKGKLTSFHTTTKSITRGTPAYMSPEQVQGEDLTPATDQFSLGVLLFEMIVGERLFEGGLGTVLKRVAMARPTGDLGRVRNLVPELMPVLNKCLAREPADRYADTADLYGALRYVRIRLGLEADLASIVEEATQPEVGASLDGEATESTHDFFFGKDDSSPRSQ